MQAVERIEPFRVEQRNSIYSLLIVSGMSMSMSEKLSGQVLCKYVPCRGTDAALGMMLHLLRSVEIICIGPLNSKRSKQPSPARKGFGISKQICLTTGHTYTVTHIQNAQVKDPP